MKNKSLYLILFFLALFSLVTLLSISLAYHNLSFFLKQLIWYILSFSLMISLIKFFNYKYLKNNRFFIFAFYLFSILLLILVLCQSQQIHGVKAWFRFGNFSFQPSEIAKFSLILILAKYFSSRHIEIWRKRHLIFSGIYFLIPLSLIIAEPDLGNASILFFIWFAIILASGIKTKDFLILLLIFIVASIFAWSFILKDYQKERITNFLRPSENILTINYQINQAKIAIGEGGFFGQGLKGGIQTNHHFLPQAHSDFIFAVFVEKWGVIGAFFLFSLYLLLFWYLQSKAFSLSLSSNFEKLFIFGFSAMLFGQIVVHLGGNLGLLPVAGINLPFLSYGGSNLLINFAILGIISKM